VKSDYVNLPAAEFIQFLANHKGSHSFQLKAMAMRWINSERLPNEPRKATILRLTEEIKLLRTTPTDTP
jgi:hypothetical protein